MNDSKGNEQPMPSAVARRFPYSKAYIGLNATLGLATFGLGVALVVFLVVDRPEQERTTEWLNWAGAIFRGA